MPDSSLPETITLTLEAGVSLTLQRIDPGSYRMGSRGIYAPEEPVHRVEITRPFYLGVTPVTQSQFGVWTRMNGVKHENGFPNRPDHPAECVDWFDSVTYCRWLTEQHGGVVPKEYRFGLPTEAEWEYACRGGRRGSDAEYWNGDGEAALSAIGWWDGNSAGQTHRVKEFGEAGRNPCGLWDMHGNVWEWCDDGWDEESYRLRIDGVQDPWTSVSAVNYRNDFRVMRGGSWCISARTCRSAYRTGRRPDYRNRYLGFRVCLFSGPTRNSDMEPGPVDGARRQAAAESHGLGSMSELDQLKTPPRSGEDFFTK